MMYKGGAARTGLAIFDFDRIGRVFCFLSLPLLNALLSPIIIISRSKELRGKLVGIFKCGSG